MLSDMITYSDRSLVLIVESSSNTLGPVMDKADDLISHAKARSTVRGYESDWLNFKQWCKIHGFTSLPADPQTVVLYLSSLVDDYKMGTIQRRVSSISQAHQINGFNSPTSSAPVRLVLAGMRRTIGTAQDAKTPLLIDDLRRMAAFTAEYGLLGIRDRAMLLIGFAGAFRRSEIVSLDVEDLKFSGEGLTIMLRRSKTDQDATGRKIGIPYGSHPETCPVRSLTAWIEAAAITNGALFRGVTQTGVVLGDRLCDRTVARRVQFYASKIGKSGTEFGGHSLRSGHATSAAIGGASERSIMNQTGHHSVTMVRRYIREGNLFRENSAMNLGL